MNTRGCVQRSIEFMDIVIKQDNDGVVMYPLEINQDDPAYPYVSSFPWSTIMGWVDEDMPFYVKELDTMHSIRFGYDGQYYTLRMNFNKDLLWYDTLYHGLIDTTGYPIDWLLKKPNDTMRFTYSNASYNMYAGMGNYYKTKDDNIIVVKRVNCQFVDTTSTSSDVKSSPIGYHLFIFNNVGELLSDKFINTFQTTMPVFHTVLFKDDGFYCTVGKASLAQQFREYSLQGEMVKQFMVDNVPTTHRLQIANGAVYFSGTSSLDMSTKTAYKSISKYDLNGTFLGRLNWDYDGEHNKIKQGEVNSFYVNKSDIYYNGSQISDSQYYAVVGRLYDLTSINEPSALLSSLLYPNPTSDNASITLDLQQASQVNIVLIDMLGRELQQIYEGLADAGTFTQSFSTNALPKGIYYIKIQIGGDVKVEKVVVN
jgi:hypothetical protein